MADRSASTGRLLLARVWSAGSRRAVWTRRVVVALVAFELVYLVAGNLFLHTEAGMAVINRKPEKVHVAFDGAWTVLPGVARVRGLEIGGRSRRVEWSTRIDRGWAWIWLPSLALRHVRIVAGKQTGVETEIDLLPRPDEPRPRKPGRGWMITLGGLRIDDLRRFVVDEYEIQADAMARGWVRFQVRGPMELRIGRVAFADGAVRSSGREVARELGFEAAFTTRPWRVKENTVEELIAGTSGSVELTAMVENLQFLEAYLRKLSWLALDGSGELSLRAELDEGAVLPGSEMALVGVVLADFYDFRARGEGRIDGRVEASGRGIALGAEVESFEMDRTRDGERVLTGEGFRTELTLSSTGLGEPPENAAGSLRLASARADDLSLFGSMLPGALDLTVESGAAEVSLQLEYDTQRRSGSGGMGLTLVDVVGSLADAGFSASGRMDVVLADLDVPAGVVDLDGTTLRLENGTFQSRGKTKSEDWSMRIGIPRGRMVRSLATLAEQDQSKLSEPPSLDADVEIAMSDTGAVVAILEQRLPKLRFVDRILTVSDVELKGRVVAKQGTLALDAVEVVGGDEDQLEILLDLELEAQDTRGVAYARYRALDATVDLAHGDRNWSVLRARRKYQQAVTAYRAERDRRRPAGAEARDGGRRQPAQPPR